MNVLHLYSGNLYGGVERLLVTLQVEAGRCPALRPAFGLCFAGRLMNELSAAGAKSHLLGPARFRRPLSIWRARRRAMELLRSAEVAICHGIWAHAMFAPVVRRANVPLVFWAHDVATGRHWLERLAARTQPDLVLANSNFTAGTVGRVFPKVPCSIAYLPVAADMTDRATARMEVRKELAVPSERTVVLIASRLEQWKGHSVLIQAIGHLRERLGWECWIAGGAQRPGEAAYRRQLEHELLHLDLACRVRFLGERTDVPRLLAAADIYCQPNTQPEPFGVVFAEALLAGVPVITTTGGGAIEIVNESCGLLVPPGNVEQLAEALMLLIRDRGLRERLGAAGPSEAQRRCDPATSLTRLHQCLLSVQQNVAHAG